MMVALVGPTLASPPGSVAAKALELSGPGTITGVLYKQDCFWFEGPDDPPGVSAAAGLPGAVFSRPSPTLIDQADREAGPRNLRRLTILTKDVQGAVVSMTWKGGR